MGLSHTDIHLQPGCTNKGESDLRPKIRQEGPHSSLNIVRNHLLSPKQNAYPNKKLLPGVVFAEIPLDACKCYPIRAFAGSNPFIVVSDRITKKENPTITVKLEPGCKTAPYPQIAFYIKGDYHTENILYPKSDPNKWITFVEFYLGTRELDRLIDSLIRVKLGLEGIKA
jgi:hypothetical protein